MSEKSQSSCNLVETVRPLSIVCVIDAFGFCCLMEFEPKNNNNNNNAGFPISTTDCTYYAFCTSGTFYTGD